MTTNKQKRAEGPRCPACENEKMIYRSAFEKYLKSEKSRIFMGNFKKKCYNDI